MIVNNQSVKKGDDNFAPVPVNVAQKFVVYPGADPLLLISFIGWWYGEGIVKFFVFLKRWLAYIADTFSVGACINTLFLPWKRDQVSYEGLSLQDRFQVLLLNLSSRLVGFIIKIMTLAVFLMCFAIGILLSIVAMIFWIGWPIIAFVFVLGGLLLVKSGTT